MGRVYGLEPTGCCVLVRIGSWRSGLSRLAKVEGRRMMYREKIPFADGTMIICGGRRSRARCKYCSNWSQFECDHPVLRKGQKTTCDTHMCARHRKNIAPNVDLCPEHATEYELKDRKEDLQMM